MPDTHSNNIRAFQLAARQWQMLMPPDLEDLWQAMGPGDFADERIPYWTEIWPSSLGLCLWLAEHDLAGKICLDLGCGLGLTAMSGVCSGAQVLACDYEQAALEIARRNAELNNAAALQFFCMDWRRPCIGPKTLDLIWAADILYEKRSFEPVLAFFNQALSPNGRIWLAEPGRALFQQFIDLAKKRGWQAEPVREQDVRPLQPEPNQVKITIWQFTPAGAKEWAN